MKFEDIQKEYADLWENIQEFTLIFLQKNYRDNFIGSGNDKIIVLRDSLQYRTASIFWHLVHLLSQQKKWKVDTLMPSEMNAQLHF